MKKEIHFCIDHAAMRRLWDSGYCCTTYERTGDYIRAGLSPIVTSSLAHMTFYLMDMGYDVYLEYGGTSLLIRDDMELREGLTLGQARKSTDANMLTLFIFGYFNELLGIKND